MKVPSTTKHILVSQANTLVAFNPYMVWIWVYASYYVTRNEIRFDMRNKVRNEKCQISVSEI